MRPGMVLVSRLVGAGRRGRAIHGNWILQTTPDSTVLSPETLATGVHSTPAELAAARAVWQE